MRIDREDIKYELGAHTSRLGMASFLLVSERPDGCIYSLKKMGSLI